MPEQVAAWVEQPADANPSKISAIGKAVAGAVAPRMLSKTASAAVGAALDTTVRPPRFVQVDWVDGKQSLIKMSESLFTHFAILLRDRRSPDPEPAATAAAVEPTRPAEPPTAAQQAFTLVSDLVRDRLPRPEATAAAVPVGAEVTERLKALAALRDQGILTEDEFVAKKSQLLDRL
ncbi:SHOCT domain-containing protein [Agrococcus sp. HG114]|uniref:SHOCT domain-containing protein n=1 Tax=Agrococcus sp. HG114 TaxID=2969757 RepID=UPI00215B7674|nr:SHOCT domain-containing protein [Agrococcus sp. HG114]MCR8669586.1 SHOCT domain-containing protein [Agrococcus sp. HG114]